MKRDKYLLLNNDNESSNIANRTTTSLSKALIGLIIANLVCALLLYIVYLIF